MNPWQSNRRLRFDSAQASLQSNLIGNVMVLGPRHLSNSEPQISQIFTDAEFRFSNLGALNDEPQASVALRGMILFPMRFGIHRSEFGVPGGAVPWVSGQQKESDQASKPNGRR